MKNISSDILIFRVNRSSTLKLQNKLLVKISKIISKFKTDDGDNEIVDILLLHCVTSQN